MRVSEYFELGRTQPSLDFVDVRLDTDVSAFVDPTAIRIQESEWAHTCQALLQSFFAEVLEVVSTGDSTRALRLMRPLSEPNEVHLGYSRGASKGRGLGGGGADEFLAAIRNSAAAHSGLLADLEDTSLLIDGIGPDIISDITSNIIRGALVGYTQAACDFYGIGMVEQYAGKVWNPDALEWQDVMADLPRVNDEVLLLVPKSIVRFKLSVDSDKYYNRILAPLLESQEIDQGSPLVEILKNGRVKVPRPKLREKYPATKPAIVTYTERFPDALHVYKRSLTKSTSPPLSNTDLGAGIGTPDADFEALLDAVLSTKPGRAGATVYHKACEKLLTALFYPYLGNVQLEKEIHEGHKRIDITYDNLAPRGTFYWLAINYHCPVIPVECKNYERQVENPELDQISGRFSDSRGWVGFIVFRAVDNKELFLDRCRDTAKDGRGYIVALDDSDLSELVKERRAVRNQHEQSRAMFKLIRERFDRLIT